MTSPGEQITEAPKLLPHSECFVFLETEPGYSPADAYAEYIRRRDEAEVPPALYYLSTTITSGGYRRDSTLSIGEAIAQNSQLARQITDEGLIERGVSPAQIVLPSELGKVPGWKQADYLQFWLYIIRNIDPDNATALETNYFKNTDSPFSDIAERMEQGTADSREAAYKEFVQEYLALKTDPTQSELLQPVRQAPAVLPVFDNAASLGCSAEYYFAEHVLPSWGLWPQSPELQEKTRQLLGNGAMIAGNARETDPDALERERLAQQAMWQSYYDSEAAPTAPTEHAEVSRRSDPRLVGAAATFAATMWLLAGGLFVNQALNPPKDQPAQVVEAQANSDPVIHEEGIVLISAGFGSLALGALGGEIYRRLQNRKTTQNQPSSAA